MNVNPIYIRPRMKNPRRVNSNSIPALSMNRSRAVRSITMEQFESPLAPLPESIEIFFEQTGDWRCATDHAEFYIDHQI